jgi:hypothetical protein
MGIEPLKTRKLVGAARYKTRDGYEAAKAKGSGGDAKQPKSKTQPAKKGKHRDRRPEDVGVKNIKRGQRKVDDTTGSGRGRRDHFRGKKPQPEKYGEPERPAMLPEGRVPIASKLFE